MNILLLGSGGREHAFAWKLSQSSGCTALFIAPGNAGTSQCGTNIDLQVTDFEGIKQFCMAMPLIWLLFGRPVKGIYDFFKMIQPCGILL